MTQYSESYCGKKSVFSQLVANNTIVETFVCNGMFAYIHPYDIKAMYWNGSEVTLFCPAMYTRAVSMNGKPNSFKFVFF